MENITKPYLIRWQYGNNQQSVDMTPLDVPISDTKTAYEIFDYIRFEMRKIKGSNCNILAVFNL